VTGWCHQVLINILHGNPKALYIPCESHNLKFAWRDSKAFVRAVKIFRILQNYIPHFQHQCLVGTLKKSEIHLSKTPNRIDKNVAQK
jgi:hypothetical protein